VIWLINSKVAFVLPAAIIAIAGWRIYIRFAPIGTYRIQLARDLDRGTSLIGSMSLREAFVSLHGRLRSQPNVEINAVDLMDHARTALIIGDPGSGKSTLLIYLALKVATEWRPGRSLVPIFLRLQRAQGSLV